MSVNSFNAKFSTGTLAGSILLALATSAAAHTTIEVSATEGQTAYNSIQVGHGCTMNEGTPSEKKLPVIAEAVVFPTDDSTGEITDDKGAPFSPALKLSDIISDASGLMSKASLVQDKNVFAKQDLIYDPDGKTVTSFGTTSPAVIGFFGRSGKLQTNLRARIPFRFSPPSFKAGATDSCVDTLLVKVAIADICKVSKHPSVGQVNLWLPHTTTIFTDDKIDGIVDSEHGLPNTAYTGAPATLTIKRTTALDASCNGEGKTAIFWPTSTWIDKTLNIPKFWTPKAP
ncbi:MAG: hypothetical protein FIA97_13570 [Methylococcaceae bacterium]|nr:hypothetical protein [Methylococcaceae bacterium]